MHILGTLQDHFSLEGDLRKITRYYLSNWNNVSFSVHLLSFSFSWSQDALQQGLTSQEDSRCIASDRNGIDRRVIGQIELYSFGKVDLDNFVTRWFFFPRWSPNNRFWIVFVKTIRTISQNKMAFKGKWVDFGPFSSRPGQGKRPLRFKIGLLWQLHN